MKRDYICTWALPDKLREIYNTSSDQEVRRLAGTLLLNYRPLVELVLLSPQGKMLDRLSVNEDILANHPRCWPPSPELLAMFIRFLEMKKAP